MSRIDELIKEKCPNGVEFKTLGELGCFYGGLTGKSKDDFIDGNAVFITYKNVFLNPALDITPEDRVRIADNEKQHTLQYGDIIFTGSSETPEECGFSSVITNVPKDELYLNSFCFFFRLDDAELFYPDFAKHLFRSSEMRRQIVKTASGVTRFNVSKKLMEKVKVPIIPIAIQKEIAGMLNSMSELEAELEAELTKRKQQYEYYRNLIFSNLTTSKDDEINLLTLNTISTMQRGTSITKNTVQLGNIPVISGGREPSFYCNQFNRNGETITIAGSGAGAGYVQYWNEPIFVNDAFSIKGNNCVETKYLYYYLTNIQDEIYGKKKGGGVPHVHISDIEYYKVPVPSRDIQKHIIKVLDSFNIVCNDIGIGLPAEIEARHKQYEYYRDKLLTFEEIRK